MRLIPSTPPPAQGGTGLAAQNSSTASNEPLVDVSSRLLGRVEGQLQPVRGQDDRKRERHAMDGVWLPAGER